MNYANICLARFMERENRFIARCRLVETNQEVVVHMKNTGRGKEVLLPEALVALQYCDNPKRKTKYDLIAVKKQNQWINLDSQLPNQLVFEGIMTSQIKLPELKGAITLLKREVRYGNSRFDFYFETDEGEKGFVEVKGMTLENKRIGAFPDAPTIRGLKHVEELIVAKQAGYYAAVIFVVQFEQIECATIHHAMQPALAEKISDAITDGIPILAYNCFVTKDKVTLKGSVPFDLGFPFEDPNR